MWLDGSRRRNIVEVSQATEEGRMLRSLGSKASRVDEVVRETEIEAISFVNIRDILGGELQAKRFHVGLEVSNFVTAYHWEHIWGLAQGT